MDLKIYRLAYGFLFFVISISAAEAGQVSRRAARSQQVSLPWAARRPPTQLVAKAQAVSAGKQVMPRQLTRCFARSSCVSVPDDFVFALPYSSRTRHCLSPNVSGGGFAYFFWFGFFFSSGRHWCLKKDYIIRKKLYISNSWIPIHIVLKYSLVGNIKHMWVAAVYFSTQIFLVQ